MLRSEERRFQAIALTLPIDVEPNSVVRDLTVPNSEVGIISAADDEPVAILGHELSCKRDIQNTLVYDDASLILAHDGARDLELGANDRVERPEPFVMR